MNRKTRSASWSWEMFLQEEAKPGLCPCCDRPLPPSDGPRQRVICEDDECRKLFNTIYQRGRRAPAPEEVAHG